MKDNDPRLDHVSDPFAGRDLTETQKFISKIKGMLIGEEWTYAEDTLRGILATVERTLFVTERQRDAVDNIRAKPSSEYGRSRWDRRW